MKKTVSTIIIIGLLFCSLCCFTACGNEKADPNQESGNKVQQNDGLENDSLNNEKPNEQNSNQNSNQGGVSLPESINTNGTPACAVTKVWFEEGPSGSLIQFEFSDRDSLGEVDVMYTDIYNSETNEWERCNECSPCDGFVARVFFDTQNHIGSYSKIRCICMARHTDKYADSVYEQDVDLKITSVIDSAGAATAEYVKNSEGNYDITVKGVEGNHVIIRAYSNAGYDSEQLFTDRNVEGPWFFFPGASPISGKEALVADGYYCILQLSESVQNPAALTLAFTDVSGWKKINP